MKDLTLLLEKETIEIPETEGAGELEQNLAVQAEEVLGYTRLKIVVENKARTLGRVIQELGIETFTRESVKAYQAAVIKEKRQEAIAAAFPWAMQRFLAQKLTENLLTASVCISFVSFLVSVVSAIVSFYYDSTIAGAMLVLWAIASIYCCSSFVAIDSKKNSIPTYIWQRFSLNERYNKDVPEFALDRAIAIKKALPSSQIFVEECAEVKDPFLVAVHGDEEYYFAVYDEPKFEANL